MSQHNHEIMFNVHGLKIKLPPVLDNVHRATIKGPGGRLAIAISRDTATGEIMVKVEESKA
jgi:hypothetical protein